MYVCIYMHVCKGLECDTDVMYMVLSEAESQAGWPAGIDRSGRFFPSPYIIQSVPG